jgi:hemoglobin-like flavoprotein/Ran GTPase-activating protein (RanGAP) involved in mRNA processing and transport
MCWWDAARQADSPLWPLARTLDLSGRGLTDADADALAETSALASITTLELADNALTDQGLGRLVRSPHLRRLRRLSVARNCLTSVAVQHLSDAGTLGRLERLDLSGNGVGAHGAELIAAHGAQLRELDLSGNAIGPAGGRTLAAAPALRLVRSLHLGDNGLGSDGVAALATSRTLESLDTLALSDNNLGAGGAAALAVATIGLRLHSLDLHGNDLGASALDVLLSSSRFANLRHLNVAGNALGPTGAMLLASTSFARRLKQLDVSDNALGDAGLAALLGGQPLAGLWDLRVARNGITGAAIALLGSAPAELDALDLSGNPLESEGLQALGLAIGRLFVSRLHLADVSGTHIPLGALVGACQGRLRHLDVSGTHLNDRALSDAASSPHLRRLESLNMSRTDVTLAGLRALVAEGHASGLQTLHIDGLRIGDGDAETLVRALESYPSLLDLSVADCSLGPQTADALARSPLTSRLGTLCLAHNRLGDDGAAALARGAWHVLRELDLEQSDISAAGIASIATAPMMPMAWRLNAQHNVVSSSVDMHTLSTETVARIESSFARLSSEGADFASRFYAVFFRKHPGVVPLFRATSMRRQHQHLMAILAFLVDNLRHPDTVAASLVELAHRHVDYGVSPAHYYAMSAVLLEAIADTLGDDWTPDVEAAWHEGLTAVVTVMLASHRDADAAVTR